MITPERLLRIRNTQNKALPSICQVFRQTEQINDIGQVVYVFTEIGAVPCRTANFSRASQSKNEDVINYENKFLLTVPYDADIQEKDKVVIDGKSYIVDFMLLSEYKTAKTFVIVYGR
jgi:hypothetical protein